MRIPQRELLSRAELSNVPQMRRRDVPFARPDWGPDAAAASTEDVLAMGLCQDIAGATITSSAA